MGGETIVDGGLSVVGQSRRKLGKTRVYHMSLLMEGWLAAGIWMKAILVR